MELNLQPRASSCSSPASPSARATGWRASLCGQDSGRGRAVRRPGVERGLARARGLRRLPLGAGLQAPGRRSENRERALKLTAETLFLTLADPATRGDPGDGPPGPLPRPPSRAKEPPPPAGPDGGRQPRDSTSTPARSSSIEVPCDRADPEFFTAVREQLTVLVGEPRVGGGRSRRRRPGRSLDGLPAPRAAGAGGRAGRRPGRTQGRRDPDDHPLPRRRRARLGQTTCTARSASTSSSS